MANISSFLIISFWTFLPKNIQVYFFVAVEDIFLTNIVFVYRFLMHGTKLKTKIQEIVKKEYDHTI